MQRSRRFGAAQDLRKSYRVEIEELKRRHVVTSVIKSDIGPVNAGLAKVKDVDLALQSQLIQVQLWWNPSVKILLLL